MPSLRGLPTVERSETGERSERQRAQRAHPEERRGKISRAELARPAILTRAKRLNTAKPPLSGGLAGRVRNSGRRPALACAQRVPSRSWPD